MEERPTITFHYQARNFPFKKRKAVKALLLEIFRKEEKAGKSVNFVFCSDQYLLKINQDFLFHDTYTDIITFVLSKPKEPILSEVYISTERVKENAGLLGVSFSDELLRIMIHGILHLCSYSDKTKVGKKQMTQMEDYYLSLFHVERGF